MEKNVEKKAKAESIFSYFLIVLLSFAVFAAIGLIIQPKIFLELIGHKLEMLGR